MRIVLVCPMPPAPDAPGAIPRVLHALHTGLSLRHDVTVITVAGPEPWALEAVDRLRADGADVRAAVRHEPRGVARWRRRFRLASGWGLRRWPWRSAWFWEPALQRELDRRFAEAPVDVIQAEDNAVGLYRYPAGPLKVLTEHEVRRPREVTWPRPGVGAARALLREEDWRRWRNYQRRAWSAFDRVCVYTRRDADLVGAMVPGLAGRVRVTPSGIVAPPPTDPAAAVPGELLFVGDFSHAPNVDAATWLAREIVPAIRRTRPEARLRLVGSNAGPAIRALAGPGVDVVGPVPDTRPYLERAQVILAPVRIGGGMRVKVLEALASGTPVVTTPRGADGLAPTAPLRVAADAEGVAAATVELLSDPAGREALGASGRRFVLAEHGPDAFARRLEAVYEEAARASAPRPA